MTVLGDGEYDSAVQVFVSTSTMSIVVVGHLLDKASDLYHTNGIL